MNKMNKIDLCYIKCLKVTDDSAAVELKSEIQGINRPCVNCGFAKSTTINQEDFNFYLQKLNIKEKLYHQLFKDFDKKLKKTKLFTKKQVTKD